MDISPRPFSENEKSLFYSAQKDADDAALATVGHLRADFGRLGNDFRSSWTPHNGDRFNTPEFKSELGELMDGLRKNGPLKSLSAMRKYCAEHGESAKLEDGAYGFIAETERFRYALRFTPSPGQYHLYLYAYDKEGQREYAEERESLLFKRLDESLLRHTAGLGDCPSIPDIHDMGGYIQMHLYLTDGYEFDLAETERLLRFEDPLEVALSCAEMDASNLERNRLTVYLDRREAEKWFPVREEAPRQQAEAAKKQGVRKGGER